MFNCDHLLTYGNDLVSCGNDRLIHGNEIKKCSKQQFYVPSWAL